MSRSDANYGSKPARMMRASVSSAAASQSGPGAAAAAAGDRRNVVLADQHRHAGPFTLEIEIRVCNVRDWGGPCGDSHLMPAFRDRGSHRDDLYVLCVLHPVCTQYLDIQDGGESGPVSLLRMHHGLPRSQDPSNGGIRLRFGARSPKVPNPTSRLLHKRAVLTFRRRERGGGRRSGGVADCDQRLLAAVFLAAAKQGEPDKSRTRVVGGGLVS